MAIPKVPRLGKERSTLPFLFGNLVALQAPGSLQLVWILLGLPFNGLLGCPAASSGHNTVLGSEAISKATPTYRHLCGFISDVARGLSLPGAFQASASPWEVYEIRAFLGDHEPGWPSHPPIPGKVPVSSPTPLLCSACIIMPQQRPCLLMICPAC